MRIALLAVLAFSGLWFVALRPKPPADVAPPPAPAAETAAPKTGSGITSAPDKAAAAVEQADKATEQRTDAASDSPATPAKPSPDEAAAPADAGSAPAPGAARKPADARSPALRRILADLDARRTAVLLFWDGESSEDREVRRAVSAVDRRGGKVRVHVQDIDRVGDFEPITRGVPVVTSPTVLVIGRDKRARVLGGLVERRELNELVGKAHAGK